MKSSTQGKLAEDKACQYLEQHGLKLIEKNYHCRSGEIDLIMQDNEILVFVEVRYRKNDDYGSAIESIDKAKVRKIVSTAKHYITHHNIDRPMRFDLIGLDASYKANWISDAFSAF